MAYSAGFLLAVVFAATLVRSALGFGEALVAVPLLALRLPVREAAPLATLISVTVAAVILLQDHQHAQRRSAAWLAGASVVGLPVGLAVITWGQGTAVKLGLGAVIAGYALYAMAAPRPARELSGRRRWLLLCGGVAGVLGGAYGMNGPPLVVYGSLRRWEPGVFRATLQAYFLPASLLGAAGFWVVVLLTAPVWHAYLMTLPAVAVALPLGRRLHARVVSRAWTVWVHAGLAAVGVALVAQALSSR